MTRMTDAGSGGSDRGGASRWRVDEEPARGRAVELERVGSPGRWYGTRSARHDAI